MVGPSISTAAVSWSTPTAMSSSRQVPTQAFTETSPDSAQR
jgi:hypothetical protein